MEESLLLDQLESFLKDINRGKSIIHSLELNALFVGLYKEVFDKEPSCSTCPSVIDEAIKELKDFFNSKRPNKNLKAMSQENQKHKAKRDVLVYDAWRGEHFQTAKMTDDEIIAAIASKPGLASRFNLAEGWEKEVADFNKKRAAELKKQPKEVADADGPAPKKPMTVLEATGKTVEEVEEFINTSMKKTLNGIAKKVQIPEYVPMSDVDLKAALISKFKEEEEIVDEPDAENSGSGEGEGSGSGEGNKE